MIRVEIARCVTVIVMVVGGGCFLLLPGTGGAFAAPREVKQEQRISDLAGGFGGVLQNVDQFGYACAKVTDSAANGLPLAAVGARQDKDGGLSRGAIWLLSLRSDGTVFSQSKISATAGGFTGMLDDFDLFGSSVSSIGDLDGNGVEDVVVGARLDDDGGVDRGAVWVLFLAVDGSVQSFQKISDTQGGFSGALSDRDTFGRSVASLGDLDGDGVTEIAVGAYLDDEGGSGSFADLGAVWILFLNGDGSVKAHQKISAAQGSFGGSLSLNDLFGTSLAALGDLDGDDVSDLAVGARGDDGMGASRGAVWILFLNADGTVKAHQKIGDGVGGFAGLLQDEDWFGSSVAAIADANGDGTIELAVGSSGRDGVGDSEGSIWTLSLDASGVVQNHIEIGSAAGGFGGTLQSNDFFGVSLAALPSGIGDACRDLLVGAHGTDDGGTERGACWALQLEGPSTTASTRGSGTSWTLGNGFPNPFTSSTLVTLSLPADQLARLEVLDIRGALIKTLWDGRLQRGQHVFSWDGTDPSGEQTATGVYWLSARVGETRLQRKVVRLHR